MIQIKEAESNELQAEWAERQSKVYSEIYDKPELFEEFKTNGRAYYDDMKKLKR